MQEADEMKYFTFTWMKVEFRGMEQITIKLCLELTLPLDLSKILALPCCVL